ncbi:MAG: cytochrome c family protein [Devosia sp.]|nr:cytochrome c family protein [Devosia sp.]
MRLLIVIFALLCVGSTAAAAGELVDGQKVFAKCKACHDVGPTAKNKVGPILNGVVGRPWGVVVGYKYSANKEGTLLAITEAEPMTWDVETLTNYLRKPKDVIPKGTMSFAGLKKDEDIENVILYLAQFDADGNEVDPEEILSALEESTSQEPAD